MKKIKIMVMLVLFLGTAVGNLFAQYLDVGDNPTKIEIASKKKIMYNGKPIGGYTWSHDGEWFLGANNDGGYIMDKNGAFLQKLPRKFNYYQVAIFYDNKRIFYDFDENKKTYYAIYNLQTRQETILTNNPLQESFIDISPQGDILFVQEVVVENKITYKFASFNPESGSKQELGVISGVSIYNEFGDFVYIDNSNLFLLVRDQEEARLKKYDFNKNKLINISNHEFYSPTFDRLKDGRHVAITVFSDAVCLYELGGAFLGKFNARFDRGGPDDHGINHDLIPGGHVSDRVLAPNGKLILIRMADRGDESGSSSNEIYLFNLKGENVRFLLPYPMFSYKWSPLGDRMLNGDLMVFLRKSN